MLNKPHYIYNNHAALCNTSSRLDFMPFKSGRDIWFRANCISICYLVYLMLIWAIWCWWIKRGVLGCNRVTNAHRPGMIFSNVRGVCCLYISSPTANVPRQSAMNSKNTGSAPRDEGSTRILLNFFYSSADLRTRFYCHKSFLLISLVSNARYKLFKNIEVAIYSVLNDLTVEFPLINYLYSLFVYSYTKCKKYVMCIPFRRKYIQVR